METKEMAKKGLYVGTGIGIVLFAMVGFIPGSFIGGFIGLKLSEVLLGTVNQTTLLTNFIITIGMVVGLIGSSLTFVFGIGILGWMAGIALDSIKK